MQGFLISGISGSCGVLPGRFVLVCTVSVQGFLTSGDDCMALRTLAVVVVV